MIDAFRVNLPESWREVPADAAAVERALEQLATTDEWGRLERIEQRRVELFMRRLAEDARVSGVRFAAVFLELVDSGGEVDDVESERSGGAASSTPQSLLAGCTATVFDRAALALELPLTAEVLQAAMSMERDGDHGIDLEPPATVELMSGPAVRLVRIAAPNSGSSVPMKCFVETYLIPVPEEYDRVIVVQFVTPNIEDSRAFSELFAAIADNVKLYRADEPTTV